MSLVEENMDTHPELTPWLAATYVVPERRAEGIGSALVQHAVAAAGVLGVERLYLYTESARPFYERLGWRLAAEEEYEGERIALMEIAITPK